MCMAKRSRETGATGGRTVAQARAAADGSSGWRGRGNVVQDQRNVEKPSTRERRTADRSMITGAGWLVNEKTKPAAAFHDCGNTTSEANANEKGEA